MARTAAGALLPLSAAAAAVFLLSISSLAANLEVGALMALKNGLQDPEGVLESWDPNLMDPCTWFHIECDEGTKRVIRIDLGFKNLSGPLVPDLGKLDQLKYMVLGENNIQGTIPDEFGNLSNLFSLDLFNNNISGPIPTSFGKLKSLGIMRIDHNRISGPIPRELVGLDNLKIVDFSNNDLCGTIPTSGPFQNFPPSCFANNPRLKGPEAHQGMDADDANC